MLPSELLRYQIRDDDILVVYVNPESQKYLQIAQDIIDIYVAHRNKTKGELAQALETYEACNTNYHVTRGFAKLLGDKSTFEITSAVEPDVLRERIFEFSGQHHPIVTEATLTHHVTLNDAVEEIAKEVGITPEEVISGMYADLDENRVMTEPFEPTCEWLLDRYNVALAQAMLYKASELRMQIYRNIPTKYKLVFKFIKFFRLMHTVAGNHQDGYYIVLDGPASILRLSQKYGIQMALFLPALLHCNHWWMEADVLMNKTKYRFKLTDEFSLKSHYSAPGEFDSKLERNFAEKFERANTEWTLEREVDIIDLKDTVMIPDFAFVHPDGRRALMEIVGFWTPDYLKKKINKLRRAELENMVIAVSEKLNCSKEDFEDVCGEVFFFKTSIKVDDVLECVERCANNQHIKNGCL